MNVDNSIPTVYVQSATALWWAILCPYCQKIHYHGHGEGHRVGHCVRGKSNAGYFIVNRLEAPSETEET